MGKARKWTGVLLSICLVITLLPIFSPPASAANASAKFKDVDQKAWYVPYIDYVVEKSLMAGTSNTSFGPDSNVTRAQYVQVLYALAGKPTEQNPPGLQMWSLENGIPMRSIGPLPLVSPEE